MLIEFSVSNFRSFRERQTFSMVAAPRLRKKENVFIPVVKGEKIPPLLKIAAIYGPNASGKSNLIDAFQVVRWIADATPSERADKPLPVKPFRFDSQLAQAPSRFEIHFVHAEQRYEFFLAATSDRIIEERLTAFPNGKEALLYDRRYLESGEEYRFGPALEGGDDLHQTWRKLTGPRVLFISQAVANSSEDLKQLRYPLDWLKRGVTGVRDLGIWAESVRKLTKNVPQCAEEVARFLQEIDVPVTSIQFKPNSEAVDYDKAVDAAELVSNNEANKNPSKGKTTLTHKTALGEAVFEFSEESQGTQNLIGFWLPWSIKGGNNRNCVIVLDELDSSLHPSIVAHLVTKHINSEMQPSQLIFSTHDTHLMDTKLLRRDQFWLTERDANGATQLRSIHDFVGRESEDIEKRYYEGRYRSLPFTRRAY